MCSWVIAELEFIGNEECAKAFVRYWRNVEDLSLILKFAQFEWQSTICSIRDTYILFCYLHTTGHNNRPKD
jgi:hypothetical protein